VYGGVSSSLQPRPNGLKLKPSKGNTGVVLMNSLLGIHNMSIYNDLAIPNDHDEIYSQIIFKGERPVFKIA